MLEQQFLNGRIERYVPTTTEGGGLFCGEFPIRLFFPLPSCVRQALLSWLTRYVGGWRV